MADTLSKVKSALGITGEYQDETLSVYIDEVKAYMMSAGVPEAVVNSGASAGVIARGVTDLWNYNGGAGKFSDYFYQRVGQLVYVVGCSEFICFAAGDYGITYPINIEGIDITENDTVIFTCGEVTKTYTGVTTNCILITFTKEESEKLSIGTYSWSLKIFKDDAVITVVNNGVLIVC